MIAEGRVIPATRDLQEVLRQYPPRPAIPGERPLSEILQEMRDEESF